MLGSNMKILKTAKYKKLAGKCPICNGTGVDKSNYSCEECQGTGLATGPSNLVSGLGGAMNEIQQQRQRQQSQQSRRDRAKGMMTF